MRWPVMRYELCETEGMNVSGAFHELSKGRVLLMKVKGIVEAWLVTLSSSGSGGSATHRCT